MRTVLIVQARIASTRLPGKVMMTVLGKPLLEYQIERLRRVRLADELVIATTDNGTEGPILDLCNRLSVPWFRGSENDVLARYHGAALWSSANVIVRVTSDCPIIDPVIVDDVIKYFKENRKVYDYVTNALVRSFPRGMDTEVFPRTVLDEAFREAQDPDEREHVTPFIYRRPERYRIGHVVRETDAHSYRLTVDTPEDFELIQRIIEALYPINLHFGIEDVLELLKCHPDWKLLNAGVLQKDVGE